MLRNSARATVGSSLKAAGLPADRLLLSADGTGEQLAGGLVEAVKLAR